MARAPRDRSAENEERRLRRQNDPEYRARIDAYIKETTDALRAEALAAYGDACECCGETTVEFLNIDHIEGVPPSHRSKSGARLFGRPFYYVLKREGFPDTCRILCFNCNLGRERNGGVCPHKGVGYYADGRQTRGGRPRAKVGE